MSYTYFLAGENLELAYAELEGFLESQIIDEKPERNSRLAVTEAEPSQLRRLALTHEVSRIVARGELNDIEPEYRPEGSFAVRAVDVDGNDYDTQDFQKQLGATLCAEDNEVDLDNPDTLLKLYLLDDEYVLGEQVLDIDRSLFQKRKNQHRPFSSPVSLDPVTARVMVNLAGVSAGEHVLDPFCGTGGILIEAGLCGIGVHGADIQDEMVSGTRKNLEEYGVIVHDIKNSDIAEIGGVFENDFGAVVTDLPYGRASKSENEPVKKFLEVWPEMADKAVFMYNEPELDGMRHDFEIYVHKNMTRYIYVQDSN